MEIKIKQDLQFYLEQHLPGYLNLLKGMVSINSFTSNADGVNALGDLTARAFEDLGFSSEREPSDNPFYGDHLVLTRRSNQEPDGPTIALVSHLDTVFPPDEERRNNFFWRVEGDRISGPGTVDIKGGTVVLYMVLEALQKCRPQLYERTNWVVLCNAAEETLVPEFGALCRSRIPADALACLIFEGGRQQDDEYSVVTARKGMATYRIQVEGRASHAGSAHAKGANAIVQLAHTLTDLAELTDCDRDVTFNVGTVAGGTVVNRVPHMAVASGEMRAFSPEVLDDSLERLVALQDKALVQSKVGGYRCRVNVDIINRWAPWPLNEAANRLLAVWQEAAANLGFTVSSEVRGGLSDGNLLWDHVPTIDGLGPIGGNAHCSEQSPDGSKGQEYVLASSFIPKAMLSATAIRILLNDTDWNQA